ncbi:unnamed protein product [Parajaminaea phylloscopi]
MHLYSSALVFCALILGAAALENPYHCYDREDNCGTRSLPGPSSHWPPRATAGLTDASTAQTSDDRWPSSPR